MLGTLLLVLVFSLFFCTNLLVVCWSLVDSAEGSACYWVAWIWYVEVVVTVVMQLTVAD